MRVASCAKVRRANWAIACRALDERFIIASGTARRRALDNARRGFVQGGAELQGPAKQRFAEIQRQVDARWESLLRRMS